MKLLIGSKKVRNGRNKGRREMNRNPSRDKRKCRLWLCSVRNWWPNSPVCTQSESLDKTTWASLASLLWHDLVGKWGVTTPVLPAMLPPRAVPASASTGHGPGCVGHIPALMDTARKYWGYRLSVLALGKSWIYNYLGWCLSELYFKKNLAFFSNFLWLHQKDWIFLTLAI